jgi:hypothetical protein
MEWLESVPAIVLVGLVFTALPLCLRLIAEASDACERAILRSRWRDEWKRLSATREDTPR